MPRGEWTNDGHPIGQMSLFLEHVSSFAGARSYHLEFFVKFSHGLERRMEQFIG